MKSQFTKTRMQKFMSYYKPHKKTFAIDLFFSMLSAVSVLLFPLVSGYITKEVLTGWTTTTQRNLIVAGVVLLSLTVLKVISNIIYAYFGHAMAARMECTMRDELLEHYEKQSFTFHAKNSVGKLMTVITNDLTGMTEVFHHAPENILMVGIKFIGAFIILININLPLTIIVFAVLPILCFAAFKTDKTMENALIKSKQNLSEMNEHLEDILSGIRTVKAFGNEDIEAQNFSKCNEKYTKSKCFFYKVEAYFYETMESYPQFLTMLTVFFGALFIGQGTLDVPVLVTFLLYVGSLAEPVSTALNFMKLYEEGKSGFVRFMDMLEINPSVTQSDNPVELTCAKGEIVFDNVSFHYNDYDSLSDDCSAENVLENISFTIHSGESAAFTGVSGIGKTTISSLLARFYDASAGTITIDGIDIKDISLKSLRNNIGIVQQEVYIFNGTIKDNIRYGKLNASDIEVQNAAKLANIHEYISKLPNGYDSIVGTKGIMLSGGQRQRISIARLFLKNPKILILDEATSALDYESELIVQNSIEKLMQNRTSVVIAHRLSTIRNADTIFVIADKKVAEHGTHDQLIAQNGTYSKLLPSAKFKC